MKSQLFTLQHINVYKYNKHLSFSISANSRRERSTKRLFHFILPGMVSIAPSNLV